MICRARAYAIVLTSRDLLELAVLSNIRRSRDRTIHSRDTFAISKFIFCSLMILCKHFLVSRPDPDPTSGEYTSVKRIRIAVSRSYLHISQAKLTPIEMPKSLKF
jgi:hypothetical protein